MNRKLLFILLFPPLIGFGQIITHEEIIILPTRDINSIVAVSAGIYQQDEGDQLNIKGSSFNSSSYIVDGVRVRGAIGIPTSAIEKITLVSGTFNFNKSKKIHSPKNKK